MDKIDYEEKMNDLLKDDTVYEAKSKRYATSESEKFNKNDRKILRSTTGKHLLYTVEETLKPPKMRGLPKVHKSGIPMRPITPFFN